MKKTAKKSHYNAERHNYLTEDGKYIYEFWNAETGRYEKQILKQGENGVTEDLIIFLDECDHDEDLQERYKRENCISDVDFGKEDSENVSQVDILAYQKYCQPNYSQNFDILERLENFIRSLKPEQIDLIYSLFGEQRQMEEIAKDEGTTRQAIYNRRKKIFERVKKFFEQNGGLNS